VPLEDAVKTLRGDPGTEVTLTIFRPSVNKAKDYKLVRAVIKVDTVKDLKGGREFKLGPDKIGYVRITQFDEKTSDDLEAALQKLKSQGMRALILDLRWNPGGLLDQAVGVCEKFLPRGQLVVSTEGRNPSENKERRAEGHGDELRGMPMVVLANYSSASAAEIVTGCLQDLKRAVVVGEKTFGKGSVQSILPFDDGSALRLTTAKYYTPSHRVIHQHGIEPNIEVMMSDDEERALALRRAPGGLESLDAKDRDAVEKLRDPQMDRATDLLKGIMLFSERRADLDQTPDRDGKMANR
jgi:carboxyl-terminal processing protease